MVTRQTFVTPELALAEPQRDDCSASAMAGALERILVAAGLDALILPVEDASTSSTAMFSDQEGPMLAKRRKDVEDDDEMDDEEEEDEEEDEEDLDEEEDEEDDEEDFDEDDEEFEEEFEDDELDDDDDDIFYDDDDDE